MIPGAVRILQLRDSWWIYTTGNFTKYYYNCMYHQLTAQHSYTIESPAGVLEMHDNSIVYECYAAGCILTYFTMFGTRFSIDVSYWFFFYKSVRCSETLIYNTFNFNVCSNHTKISQYWRAIRMMESQILLNQILLQPKICWRDLNLTLFQKKNA